ncbi:hypothetical protein [Arthrobacter sp. B6]|uniref:hypothetical protein n=1 Tax=Arthrobacter sp. B6 TaxID=1570137 RepID=UPI0018D3C72B|nr:hypothetical protein [Arthrobacter sp. B6]
MAAEYLEIRKLISGYYSLALNHCGTGLPLGYRPPTHRRVPRRCVRDGDLVTLVMVKPNTRRASREIDAAIMASISSPSHRLTVAPAFRT